MPKKFDKCVKEVKKRGGPVNAYAVCRAAGTKKNKGKKNPSEYAAAAEASEDFHGIPAHEDFQITTKIFEYDNLGDCGELVELVIVPVHGGKLISLKKFKGARLAQSPKGEPYQLYIEGGDQSVDLETFDIDSPHATEVLGKLKTITYYTVKHHLGRDGGEANYKHKLNEEDLVTRGTKAANRPTVIYDVLNKLLSMAGGEYTILPEGIDN